jgi:ABC-type tungstate transport system substrate-binding protein
VNTVLVCPVVEGLVVAMSLWRSGFLGDLRLIYTPTAIVIAQVIIAFPVAAGLTTASLQALDPVCSSCLALDLEDQMIWSGRMPATAAAFGSIRFRHLCRPQDGGGIYGTRRA